MAKETTEQLITKALEKYQDNKIRVAFLGKVSSGKTVFSALLKYTLFKYWIPQTNGRWDAISISGQDEINEIIQKMKKGKFPGATLHANYPKFVTEIYNMEGPPQKHELILHDISGENYADYLTNPDYNNIEELLRDLLSGDGSYIPFVKKYVIMIDCEEKDEWDTDIAKVGPMISKIRKIKQKIHNFDQNETIHASIAIVFTKADLLSPEDQAKTIEELSKDYPELISSLHINHDRKNLKFFKVSISTTMETDQEVDIRVNDNNNEINDQYEQKLKTWNVQINSIIDSEIPIIVRRARQDGLSPEEITQQVQKIESQIRQKHKQQFDQTYPRPKNNKTRENKSKINIPLVYTESEYSKLISWILDL